MDALALSEALARAVETVAQAVVRVANENLATAGLLWGEDLVLAAGDAEDDGLKVIDAGGRETEAQLLGRDAGTGVVVLRAGGVGGKRLATADAAVLKVGHLALAIARPGRSARATFGMITTLGDAWRTRWGGRIDRYIDTSIVVPPEFGGAVIADAAGRLIGLGVLGRRHRGIIVPPATLERIAAAALAGKGEQRGYLGIASQPVRIPAAQRTAAGQERGLLVSEVEEQSPAARAGIALGDVVLALGGSKTEHIADLFGALADAAVGSAVSVRVLRAGKVQDFGVTVGARPA